MNSHRMQSWYRPMFQRGLSDKRYMHEGRVLQIGCRFFTITILIFSSLVMSGCVGNNYPELSSTEELDQTRYEYATFVTSPVVTGFLAEFSGSQNQQVKIVSPGSDARGLTEFAEGNNAVLVRKEGDRPKNYSLRVDHLIRKGDISANVHIKPGDIFFFPERWF